MDKEKDVTLGIGHIMEILKLINPDKAKRWRIKYKLMNEELFEHFTDFEKTYHGLIRGEEYILVYEYRHLLYAINVTGNSVLYTLRELFALLGNKF